VKPIILATALVALAGCALPTVDRAASGFDETQYASDLSTCRGGNAAVYAVNTFTGALVGSAIGAFEGAVHLAWHGDSDEWALIGAAVGGTLGFVYGAYTTVEEEGTGVEDCLREKGYVLSSV
jgi:hypothetical protein